MPYRNYPLTLVAVPLLCLILLGGLAACTENTTPQPTVPPTVSSVSVSSTISITAVDYGYSMASTIDAKAGLVNIALVNNGNEPHQAQVARLNPGVTREKVLDELVTKKNQEAAFSLLTFVGGADTISPGYGQEAILNLSEGQYVLLCFVVGADGIAHTSKGMIHFFNVVAQQNQQSPPPLDGKIIMKDFSYELPASILQSRALTLQISNQGSEIHELNIVKLARGKSAQDVSAFFQSPSGAPPFEELGGMAALRAGDSAWIKIHLEPGNYAVYSFIPDIKTGKSQLSLGMIRPFSVQ